MAESGSAEALGRGGEGRARGAASPALAVTGSAAGPACQAWCSTTARSAALNRATWTVGRRSSEGSPARSEQAAAIVFLASDAASNINGVILPVDDGWSAV